MLNQDKFKTAEERANAFHEWCGDRQCNYCVFSKMCGGCDVRTVGIDVMAHWLALEAEEEKPEPCPFCGRDVKAPNQIEQTLAVVCQCGYRSEWKACVSDAISAHNRVARAVRAAREGEVK